MGEKWGDKREEWVKRDNFATCLFSVRCAGPGVLAHPELNGLRESFAVRIGNGERVSGGFLGRKIEAAVVRRPDAAFGRVEGYGFRVGDVVAKLRGFAAMNDPGRNVERANGEFGAAELLNSGPIVGAALLGGFFGVALFEGAVGFIAGEKQKGDIAENDGEDNPRIKIGIFEEGLL